MLPKKIVDDLKQGNPVRAETFESVTIFFRYSFSLTSISVQP